MSKDSKHVLGEPEKLNYPGGKHGMYRVACSCGYQTNVYAYPRHALKVAQQHREAMEPPVYGVFGEGG